tara:strand:- start:173 stop:2197 length:2025 start_codon:yes stop_codon:yes gene_type:complete
MSRTLTVYLAANLKNFSQGLRKGEEDLGTFGNATRRLGETLSASLGPALIAAGAAAAYAAVQFGVDGVKAFVDDDAAAQRLAKTMANLGMEGATAAVEGNIDSLQRQFGVADDLLRPSMEKLLRVFGDVGEASRMMSLALDVSAGTGASLEKTVQALSRAANGNALALGKIAPELDKNILKSGDMVAITGLLADTFAGQAQTAAGTMKGQLARLAVGFDELKEAFGKGFLEGLDKAGDKTDELAGKMRALEPKMEKAGKATFDFGVAALDAGTWLLDLNNNVSLFGKGFLAAVSMGFIQIGDGLHIVSDEAGAAARAEYQLYLATNNLIGMMDDGARAAYALGLRYQGLAADALAAANANSANSVQTSAASAITDRYTKLAVSLGGAISKTGGNLDSYFTSVSRAGGGSSAAAKETDVLTTAFDKQRDVVEGLQETLDSQVSDLERATQAVRDYSQTLATQLLGGIDLGAAQETGAELGTSTLEAFDAQIAQAQWFGNVLSSIRASGADQRLIDQLAALGPAAGGKLAQEMIDKGLVQTFSDRLVDVIATATTVSQAMVPEFLTAGVDSATDFVDGTIEQLLLEQDRLKKIGKTMGKAIGVNIKAEIAQAVAEAVAAAQAAKTAAAAERAAEIAAQNVVVSEQQIAQALQRLITNSNSRAGYSMGVPVQTPVLG